MVQTSGLTARDGPRTDALACEPTRCHQTESGSNTVSIALLILQEARHDDPTCHAAARSTSPGTCGLYGGGTR